MLVDGARGRFGAVIVFGVCAGPTDTFERIAQPALERVREPDSIVIVLRGQTSICRAYNEMIDRALRLEGAEALVLIHDDLEIPDSRLCERLRRLCAEPDVAVVGVAGARGVRKLGWWEGARTFGGATAVTAESEFRFATDVPDGTHDVDTVDGILLALSPAGMVRLRFDEETFPGFDGYDGGLCADARAVGLRVVVTDLEVRHHNAHARSDPVPFHRADLRWQLKWRPMPSWKRMLWRLRLPATPVELKARRGIGRIKARILSPRRRERGRPR